MPMIRAPAPCAAVTVMRAALLAVLLVLLLAPAAGAADVVPGQLVVGYEPGTAREPVREAARGRLEEVFPDRTVELLRVPRGSERAVARVIERRDGVRFAEPNLRYETAATPDDPFFAQQWALPRVGAPAAWDVTTGSEAVRVAVLDTGVDLDHPDLQPNVWTNPGETPANATDDDGSGFVDDVRGWDFVGNDAVPEDEGTAGHGTHVAGVLGAAGANGAGVTGMAWRTSLVPLRVCAADQSCTTADQAAGIQLARSYGVRVVNLSITGSPNSSAVNLAIADSPGTLFVAAAGNAGADLDATPTYPCAAPGPNVLCVAATNGDDTLAATSNRGRETVDLAAPGGVDNGVGITSTMPFGAYGAKQGTSFSAPLVSGAAALLWSRRPTASVGAVRRALLASVDRVGALDGLVAGGGRLNVARALQEIDRPHVTIEREAPEFTFTADQGDVRFECRVDDGPPTACTSPLRLDLPAGAHRLAVRAVTPDGLAGPDAVRVFSIAAEPEPAGPSPDVRQAEVPRPLRLAREVARRFAGRTGAEAARMRAFRVPYDALSRVRVAVDVRVGERRVGGARLIIRQAGERRVRVTLTTRGRKVLRRTRTRRVVVSATVRAIGGTAVAERAVKLR